MAQQRSLRFALIQMSMSIGDKAKNISKAEIFIDKAAEDLRARVIGLPEFFSTEYFSQWLDRKFFDYAETIPGPTTERLSKKAREHGVYIFAPMYEMGEPGIYYDSSVLLAPNGAITGIYRKVTTGLVYWPEGGDDVSYEPYYFRTGAEWPLFQVEDSKVGQLICYDRHFPEHWRVLVLRGADILFIPIASSGFLAKKGWGSIYPSENQAFAFVNQCFVASVNRVGLEGNKNFYGGSHIIAPDGRFLAGPASDSEEQILCAEIDLAEIVEVRRRNPLLRDRRPELYSTITQSQPVVTQGIISQLAKYFS